jgi:hypothetical protein
MKQVETIKHVSISELSEIHEIWRLLNFDLLFGDSLSCNDEVSYTVFM